MLKRQVRRARLERDAALEASEGFRKKERLYALREKQAELALSRVQAVEKERDQQDKLLAHKGRALLHAQGELQSTRAKCERRAAPLRSLLLHPRPSMQAGPAQGQPGSCLLMPLLLTACAVAAVKSPGGSEVSRWQIWYRA